MMDYEAVLAQVLALLQQEQRLSYRVLKRRLHLDDDLLEDLKEDLIYAKKLAVDEDGRVLVWTGGTASAPTTAPLVPLPAWSKGAPAQLNMQSRPGALAGAPVAEAPQGQETNPTNGGLRLKCGFMRVSHGAPVTSSLQRPLNTGGRFSTKARIASLESSYFDNSAVMPCSKR